MVQSGKKSLFGDNKKVNSNKKLNLVNSQNWVWWALGVFVVLFLVLYFFFSSLGTFEYKGLSFQKERYSNELTLYHHSYYFTFNGQTYKQNIYLRNDPRDNEVPISDEIIFSKSREVHLGINNTGIIDCEDSSIAIGTIAQFLGNPQLVLSRGTVDREEATEKKQRYISCEKDINANVVIIQSGNQTEIIKKDHCYFININSCEIQPAVEKFIINALVDARENAQN